LPAESGRSERFGEAAQNGGSWEKPGLDGLLVGRLLETLLLSAFLVSPPLLLRLLDHGGL